jgi:competence protein ComEC
LEVTHVLDPAAFPEDCRRADVLVTALKAPAGCGVPLLIDGVRLAQLGAHAVRVDKDGSGFRFAVTTERSAFPRPWQARRAPAVNTSAGDP